MTSGTVVYTGGGIGMSAGPKISATEKVIPEGAGCCQEEFCALLSDVWSVAGHAEIRPVTLPGLDPGVAPFGAVCVVGRDSRRDRCCRRFSARG